MTTAERIERRWNYLLEQDDLDEEVKQMIREAWRRPALKRLFPFLSLNHTLRFSGSTKEPYTWDRPFIVCKTDCYEAHIPDSGKPPMRGSLSEALDMVVAALRPGDDATDDPPPI